MDASSVVRQRLLAYILPRRPQTEAQETALSLAVEAQVEFEAVNGLSGLPGNVSAISNDGVSMTFIRGGTAPDYTRDTISPAAWSILRNTGLIAYALPTARKP